jgi:ribosomal protein S18 acetylase RimI-like enzyme
MSASPSSYAALSQLAHSAVGGLVVGKAADIDIDWSGDESAIRIRAFEHRELGQLLNIFSEAVPRAQLSRSIYVAPGAEAFLARLLEHPSLHTREHLWGVELKDKGFVAAAHTRFIEERHHLNNCAVLPALQGRGLGGRMMAHWESLARLQRSKRLTLDVDLENERARRHYARFGFSDQARSYEYQFEGSRDFPAPKDVHLIDWAVAQACFQIHGFGRFALALGGEHHSVDFRVGEFRLGSRDARLLSALQAIDPSRRILVRTPEVVKDPLWAHTGTIVHMIKEL